MFNLSRLFTGIIICVAIGNVTAVVADGSSPNGKPFVKINNELIEVTGAITSLQDQVDMLINRVDTVEERALSLETAVADIMANNIILETLISQNTTDISTIAQTITNLESDNQALLSQINDNTVDIQIAQAKIAANEALILSLQTAIFNLENGSITADADLQAQINNNLALITIMEGEINLINESLALKQNIITGTCPDGQAVTAVTDDSITCTTLESSTGITSYYRTSYIDFAGIGDKGMSLQCLSGSVVTGGGYITVGDITIYRNSPDHNGVAWQVLGRTQNPGTLHVYVNCLRVD